MRRRYLLPLFAPLLITQPAAARGPTENPGPYISARAITPGSPVPTGGDGVAIACSGPGSLRLVFANGTTTDLYTQQGTAVIDGMAIVDVNAQNSNAPCTVTVLYRGP